VVRRTGSIPAAVGYMMVSGRPGFNDARQAMTDGKPADTSKPLDDNARSGKPLPEAARRALAEAEKRREDYLKREAAMPKEIGGRGGKEPGRYGDWEIKGLTSDF
jgi:hypothetical protein